MTTSNTPVGWTYRLLPLRWRVIARGATVTPREAPDAATYISRSMSSSPYRYIATVRYSAAAEVVAQHFSPTSATIEADGPDSCVVTAGADDPERLVLYLGLVGCDFEIIAPPEVISAAQSMDERLRRAGAVVGKLASAASFIDSVQDLLPR